MVSIGSMDEGLAVLERESGDERRGQTKGMRRRNT